ncbi:MAG: hypothetical protein K2R98_21515 [Gemmataceae bacterium]|nr:hypothetical protein [Gemmataceae bacterium]
MVDRVFSAWFRWLGGAPCFRIYGKARPEADWHIIDVFATHRRNSGSSWPAPFFRGTCITWTSQVIAVGWDFAESVLREQADDPASRDRPVAVAGGRIGDWKRRVAAGASSQTSACEVLAHECGHTGQVRRLGVAYWPIGGTLTLFREGPHWYNRFENQASEEGLFGGIVNGSVCAELMERLQRPATEE